MGCSPRSAAYRLKEQFRAVVLCVCCRAVLELLEKAKTYFLVAAGGRRKWKGRSSGLGSLGGGARIGTSVPFAGAGDGGWRFGTNLTKSIFWRPLVLVADLERLRWRSRKMEMCWAKTFDLDV